MRALLAFAMFTAACIAAAPVQAEEPPAGDPTTQDWALRGQATIVLQANAGFRSPYDGPNSLNPGPHARETIDFTAYVGVRPWKGAEVWVNPEIDQGFGLSNTLGVAGFPSGEAYKVGKVDPYAKLPRWFIRQTIDLGGETEKVDADLNQLAGSQTANRLVLTLGKFSVVDVFDTSDLAHDPRSDFLNWSIIDAGTFDYAANAWGYTYGAAAELYEGRWTARAGVFDLSDVPNSAVLDPTFGQVQFVGEVEERHSIAGHAGRLKVTAFLTRGRMGRFEDAIRLSEETGLPADIAAVRKYRSRMGVSFNFEQEISKAATLFVKGGAANGKIEPYEFADIDRTLVAGVSIKGAGWGRDNDVFAVAAVNNVISSIHERFLDAGGLGILVGDGKLPHSGPEQIIESYYDLAIVKALHLAFDGQFVRHPAYNRDRGPVAVGTLRLHAEF